MRNLLRSAYSRLPFPIAATLARGRPNLAFWIGDRSRRLTIDHYLGRFQVEIDTGNDIERRMLSGSYEPDIHRLIRSFVREGSVVADVGANVGAHTLALADLVGPAGAVHAFEPGPAFAARLRANLEANPSVSSRVVVHEIGLSDQQGVARWQASRRDVGTGSCAWVDPSRESHEIQLSTLDAWAEEARLQRLDFLKIDVDGMDHLVLRGGARTIERLRPVLIFEALMCDSERIDGARQAAEQLERARYRLYSTRSRSPSPTKFPHLSVNTLALPLPS